MTVYDQKKLKKMGMNALLGVGQGSVRGSYLVTIEWKGTKSKSKPFWCSNLDVVTNNSELALQQAMQLPSQTNTEKQGCSQPPESKGQEFAEIMNTLKQQKSG